MVNYTTNYTVSGSGTVACDNPDQYAAEKANMLAAPDKFTITSDDPVNYSFAYNMNFTINDQRSVP